MQEKVSVIVTTYNRRHFLEEALESVSSQIYRNFEVIVVDDGSSDGSEEVALKYGVRYVWQKNSGISAARNLGFKLGSGEFIAYLDADDLWEKEKLDKQVKYLSKHTEYPLCYTDETWLRNGSFLNQSEKHRKTGGDIFSLCLPICRISPSSALFRRRVLESYSFDERLPVCEDYDLWLRISRDHPVGYIPERLIVKRGGHADQLSRKYPAMDIYRIRALRKLLAGENLNRGRRELVESEINRKSVIVSRGAWKRGRLLRSLRYLYFSLRYS